MATKRIEYIGPHRPGVYIPLDALNYVEAMFGEPFEIEAELADSLLEQASNFRVLGAGGENAKAKTKRPARPRPKRAKKVAAPVNVTQDDPPADAPGATEPPPDDAAVAL